MNRQQGYDACTELFPGIRVTAPGFMISVTLKPGNNLVRVHSHTVALEGGQVLDKAPALGSDGDTEVQGGQAQCQPDGCRRYLQRSSQLLCRRPFDSSQLWCERPKHQAVHLCR